MWWALIVLSLSMTGWELARQYRENRFLRAYALDIINRADARDVRSRVEALRDYIRNNIRYQEAPYANRPFLRDTAVDTLNSREGYCGEVTRAFIRLAEAVDIPAQRINLYGAKMHVVAEAELGPGDRYIVDCQNPPQIAGLERLDQVILRPEYDDYYTLNLRRLRINWLVSRIKTEIGMLTYWTESPHLIKATMWFGLFVCVFMMGTARVFIRFLLQKRGWVHVSELQAVTNRQD